MADYAKAGLFKGLGRGLSRVGEMKYQKERDVADDLRKRSLLELGWDHDAQVRLDEREHQAGLLTGERTRQDELLLDQRAREDRIRLEEEGIRQGDIVRKRISDEDVAAVKHERDVGLLGMTAAGKADTIEGVKVYSGTGQELSNLGESTASVAARAKDELAKIKAANTAKELKAAILDQTQDHLFTDTFVDYAGFVTGKPDSEQSFADFSLEFMDATTGRINRDAVFARMAEDNPEMYEAYRAKRTLVETGLEKNLTPAKAAEFAHKQYKAGKEKAVSEAATKKKKKLAKTLGVTEAIVDAIVALDPSDSVSAAAYGEAFLAPDADPAEAAAIKKGNPAFYRAAVAAAAGKTKVPEASASPTMSDTEMENMRRMNPSRYEAIMKENAGLLEPKGWENNYGRREGE